MSGKESAPTPAAAGSFRQTLDGFLIDAFVVSKAAVILPLLAALAVPFLILALLQLCTSRKACLVLFACVGTAFLVVQIVFVVRFALNL